LAKRPFAYSISSSTSLSSSSSLLRSSRSTLGRLFSPQTFPAVAQFSQVWSTAVYSHYQSVNQTLRRLHPSLKFPAAATFICPKDPVDIVSARMSNAEHQRRVYWCDYVAIFHLVELLYKGAAFQSHFQRKAHDGLHIESTSIWHDQYTFRNTEHLDNP